MVMDRETSHHQACTSHGTNYSIFKKSSHYINTKHMSPQTTRIERNLVELSLQDLLQLTKQLKYPNITTLRLFVCPKDQLIVSQHFGNEDKKTTNALFKFSRAIAHAIEGWLQKLELGICLGLCEINTLCLAIRFSTTLQHLSFANSRLGDVTLQVLSSPLQHCKSLQTLNLSSCALTDVSASIITTIVKGDEPNAQFMPQNVKKKTLAKYRAPKYGQQWRQNVILIGKWSPIPDLADTLINPKTKINWQTTLRKPTIVGNNCHRSNITPLKSINIGLVGLDLSNNSFTDALSKELCPLLYKKPPLCALNLRCNQMTRAGAKPFLDVMKELHILQFVDIRGNLDEGLLGVLENGEHYTTFSTYQSPFWLDSESLDPILYNTTKSQSHSLINRSKFTSSSKARILERQIRATMASQHTSRDRTTRSCNLSPQNSSNNIHTRRSRNNTPSRMNKMPSKYNNNSPQANISPSFSRASIVTTPTDQWESSGTQKRYHYSYRSTPCEYFEKEDAPIFNHQKKRCILAPRKERPTSSSTKISPPRSIWPKKTILIDQTNQKNISPSQKQDFDTRIMSSGTLEPPQEHSIWDSTTLHEFDLKDTKRLDSVLQRHATYEGSRRAQSAGYNMHKVDYPKDYHDFYREVEHKNCYKIVSTSQSLSKSSWPLTIYNQNKSQGERSKKKPSSIICCHHRCKLLNEVQEQKKNRSRIVKAIWLEDHGPMPYLHPLVPKVTSLSDNKKELIEWNNFVNQMTTTLLNLKDGFDQLIGPSEGAIAQQATTKLNQMPSSFFRSGMLRLLERSCKVLNTYITSLTKRHKENMRHVNSENQAPNVNGEILSKEKNSKVNMDQKVLAQQEKQFDKCQKTLQNGKQFNVQPSNNQHQMIYHPNLSPLTTSKRINILPSTK